MKDLSTKLFFFVMFIVGLAVIIFLYSPPDYLVNSRSNTNTNSTDNSAGTNSTYATNPNTYNYSNTNTGVGTQVGSIPASTDATSYVHSVTINNTIIPVEIADSESARMTGLSGRAALAPQAGLFFILEKPSYQSVWMKDMLFPIDIIWFDETYTIIQIDKNVYPNTYPATYAPNRPAKYILEVNAGFTDSNAIRTGDKIRAAN